MHLATKAKQENETEEAVQYDVNSTSSIKDDVSEFRYINYRTRANNGRSCIVAAPWKMPKIGAFY